MKRLIYCLSGMCIVLLTSYDLLAQEENNPLLYSYQAVMFGDQNTSHDPATLVMPGTAYASGFSSYLENPASAAFFDKSFGSFGLAFRSVDESVRFIDRHTSMDDNQTGISNAGFVYRFPAEQGSLVIGAGYSQHSFYNRALSISGRNENSSITDQFKIPGSPYGDIAFSTFAIDSGDEIGDWDESIFRVGFDQYGDFLGINQEGEITERGRAGDYSAFMATEFLQNIMVGASVGIRSGRYHYGRTFLEIDEPNFYDGTVIDSNDDGQPDTNIDNILMRDDIRSNFTSFVAKVGTIFRVNPNLHLGASYTFPTRMTVNEEFDARIVSEFNNGVSFEDDLATEFTYRITTPARISFGAALVDIGGLTISGSAEYVDHSRTRIDFDADLFEDERIENNLISDTYRDVWNLRGGAALALSDQVTLRGGYGIRPSKFRNIDFTQEQFSGGIGFKISENTRLDISAQYTMWDEPQSSVYELGVYDYSPLPDNTPSISTSSEFASRDVNRLQVMASIRFNIK